MISPAPGSLAESKASGVDGALGRQLPFREHVGAASERFLAAMHISQPVEHQVGAQELEGNPPGLESVHDSIGANVPGQKHGARADVRARFDDVVAALNRLTDQPISP